ncbi:hypothetical protein NliqN6_2319 [Naganishia liquefaciens]|uniref:Protein CPL1-like domain-containing protein n=1 Tax=Naganishia liquefaciens TaxID=104408 RepID=A0A8H3YF60_9TREE|nr:hypothetical protein NliqN6_2319 [Naganishia liquefaciens]
MRFLQPYLCVFFEALALLLAVSAAPLEASSTTKISPQRDTSDRLKRRQEVVRGTVCATVPIRISVGLMRLVKAVGIIFPSASLRFLFQTLIDGICLCTQAGVLTPDSVARLDAQISSGGVLGGLLTMVVNLVGGLTNLLGLGRIAGQNAVASRAATCPYPANSSPLCTGGNTLPGTTCSFQCNTGYKLCGTSYCIADTASCVSGIPGRRSQLLPPSMDNAASLCPVGLEACYTSHASLSLGKPVGWECIDTSSDLESCGGCEWPVSGKDQGEDCSSLEGVSEVACTRGKCEASSCMRGFVLNGTQCVSSAIKPFWATVL